MLKPREREDWNRRYAAKEFIWTVDANRFLVKASRVERPVKTDDGVEIAVDCLVRGKRP